MQSRLFLNIVIGESSPILQLLSSEDQPLLVGRNPFLVLNLRLHVVNSVRRLDLESDRLSRQSLYENLHATPQAEDWENVSVAIKTNRCREMLTKVKGRLLLDIVIGKRAPILKLFTSEDKTLLVGRDTLLVLNLRLDIVDSVRRLHFKSDGLARQCLDEDLHAATEAQDEMKSRFLLDVVVRQCTAILELFSSENETLLVGRNAKRL